MDEALINSVFRPKPTRQETKADVTTRVARDIMDKESAARDAKTERLRTARLAREAAVASEPQQPTKKRAQPHRAR
jgi:hypothetical protein